MKSIREIAKLAGVSSATVSRYMNDTAVVSKESSRKIAAVLKENEYHPNKLTSAIFSGKSNDIALIVQNIMNPFFAQLVEAMETYIDTTKYSLIIYNCNGNREIEAERYKKLLERRIAGVLVINTTDESIYSNHAVPIIAVEKPILDYPKVAVDNKQAITKIFENLELDNSRLLMIKGNEGNYSSMLREQYFIKLAAKAGSKCDIHVLADDLGQLQSDVEIDLSQYQTIFCWTDMVAHKVYSEVLKQGLHIPEDIQLIGFDGLAINSIFSYQLTTIDQEIENLGKVAVGNLINLIEGQKVEDSFLDCKFKRGNTTK